MGENGFVALRMAQGKGFVDLGRNFYKASPLTYAEVKSCFAMLNRRRSA